MINSARVNVLILIWEFCVCVGHIHSPTPISFQINVPSFLTQFSAISPSLHQGQSVMPKYSQACNPSSPRHYKLPVVAWLDMEVHSRSPFPGCNLVWLERVQGFGMLSQLLCVDTHTALLCPKDYHSGSRPLDTDSTFKNVFSNSSTWEAETGGSLWVQG